MRLPLSALGAYLDPVLSADEIAAKLTAIGFEVEGQEASADGPVLEINVTPNRGDVLSVRGLARELCAALDRPFSEISCAPLPTELGGKSLTIDLPDSRCPRYLGVAIRGVKNGASPAAVQQRLEAFGVRPISILVDAANWVMLELGQPLHTFDLDTMKGGITVRAARAGEALVTLDGQRRELTPWQVKGGSFAPLLICDGAQGARPIAIAGVMGGDETEISDLTRNIYLEAATFDPLAVRRAARKFTLLSEASHRFERGVDPALPRVAAARFIALLKEWGAGGEVAGWRLIESSVPVPVRVTLRLAALCRLIGIAIPAVRIEKILATLGLNPAGRDGEGSGWTIPSWRPDLTIEEDLIEEIARHHGYDGIPPTLPQGIDPSPGPEESLREPATLRDKAGRLGYTEMVTIPFVSTRDNRLIAGLSDLAGDESGQDSHALPVTISNPIWLDRPELRAGLPAAMLPAMMEGLEQGSGRFDYEQVKVYEIGRVFIAGSPDAASGQPSHREEVQLCLMRMFSRKIGTVESRCHELLRDLAALTGANPGRRMVRNYPDLLLRGDNPGFSLHLVSSQTLFPRELRHNFDLGVVQLRLEGHSRPMPTFVPYTDASSVLRDLGLLLPFAQTSQSVRETAQAAQVPSLESLAALDTGFMGSGVPEGHRALAVRFTFRKPDGTLTSEEADAGIEKIKTALARIGVTVRGA